MEKIEAPFTIDVTPARSDFGENFFGLIVKLKNGREFPMLISGESTMDDIIHTKQLLDKSYGSG